MKKMTFMARTTSSSSSFRSVHAMSTGVVVLLSPQLRQAVGKKDVFGPRFILIFFEYILYHTKRSFSNCITNVHAYAETMTSAV